MASPNYKVSKNWDYDVRKQKSFNSPHRISHISRAIKSCQKNLSILSSGGSHTISLQSSESKDTRAGSVERCQTFSHKKDGLINEYASGSTAYNTAEKNGEECVNLKRGLRNLSFLKRY